MSGASPHPLGVLAFKVQWWRFCAGASTAVTVSLLDVLNPAGSNPVEGFVNRRLDALASCRDAAASTLIHSLLRFMPDTGFLRPGSDSVARIMESVFNRGKMQARPCAQTRLWVSGRVYRSKGVILCACGAPRG